MSQSALNSLRSQSPTLKRKLRWEKFNTQHIEVISDHLGKPNSSPSEMVQALVGNGIVKSDINYNERTELEETADIYWDNLSLSIEDFIIHCRRAGVLAE